MNRLMKPTEYAKSGLVFTKYRREPTTLRYMVGSIAGAELTLLSFRRGSIGVALELQSVRPAVSRMLAA